MKIVVATTTAFHLRYLAGELARHAEDVTFCSYLPRWKTRRYGLADAQVRSVFPRLQPFATLALWRGGGRSLQTVRERLLTTTDRAIARTLPPCEIFIGLSSMAIASARAARERHGARVIIERGSSHVLEQARILADGGGTPLSDRYVARELESYEVADTVVVPSRFAARTFLDRGFPAERLKIMMLGVDTGRFRPAATPPALPVRALFVGQWSRRKGADLLAAALDRAPSLRLTHVGLPVDVPLPDHPRFRSLGYLDHGALSALLPQHHMLVLPSREDGFGMVMTEALAAGLRIVASDATGAPDLAEAVGERHVSVFPAGSLAALVAAVERQTAAIEADPDGFRPAAADVEMLSWLRYGERYRHFLRNQEPGA